MSAHPWCGGDAARLVAAAARKTLFRATSYGKKTCLPGEFNPNLQTTRIIGSCDLSPNRWCTYG